MRPAELLPLMSVAYINGDIEYGICTNMHKELIRSDPADTSTSCRDLQYSHIPYLRRGTYSNSLEPRLFFCLRCL